MFLLVSWGLFACVVPAICGIGLIIWAVNGALKNAPTHVPRDAADLIGGIVGGALVGMAYAPFYAGGFLLIFISTILLFVRSLV